MSQINFRIGEIELSLMEEIAKFEHISLAELSKRMVLKELTEIRKDVALRLYEEGKIRKKRALELSGIPYHEFLLLCKEKNVVEPLPDTIIEKQMEWMENVDFSQYFKYGSDFVKESKK